MAQITLNVNGKSRTVDTDPTTPLLYVLRDDLELKGPRFGCGLSQCGYCMNGMIMSAKVLLDKNPHPGDDDIKRALEGNLCRCGSHLRVVRAVKRAAASV